jgi:hypothetical protein
MKCLGGLSEGEGKGFTQDYADILAANYRASRQYSVDKSGYAGANVALARDPKELYDFIARHDGILPSFGDFRWEFNKNVKYVKTFKVDKAKEAA